MAKQWQANQEIVTKQLSVKNKFALPHYLQK
jgi:hypothetical protein